MAELKAYRRSELEELSHGCLLRYRKVWMEGVDDASDLSLVGIGFHAISHAYIMRLLAHQLPSDSEESQQAFTEGVVEAKTPARLIPELRELWDFHAANFLLPWDRFVVSEERQQHGQISWAPDLVLAHSENNSLEIKDFKSGWAPPPSEDDLKMLFQARVYSFYGRQRWPNFSTYRFTINAIRWNKSTSVVFTQEDLDGVERELRALIAIKEEAERTNHWPAVPGPSCTYCTLKCPLVDQVALVPKRFAGISQAQQMGGWILAAEQMLKAAKKALKQYSVANGPIQVNGIEWANRAVETRTFPVDDVMAALEKVNIVGALEDSATDGLTLSYSSLAKLFKKFPLLLETLSPVMQSKESFRFSAKKIGYDENAGKDDEE